MDIPVLKESFRPVADLIHKSISGKILMSALEMKIFDYLEGKYASEGEVARVLNAETPVVEAMLDCLVSMGFVVKGQNGYTNTLVASGFLVSTAPAFQGPYLKMTFSFFEKVAQDIPDLIKNSRGAVHEAANEWASPETIAMLGTTSFHGGLQNCVAFVKDLPGFDNFGKMCDVGGSHGFYSMGILDENPKLEAVVCDLPDVVEQAAKVHADMGYGKRISVLPVDIGEDNFIGSGYDLVLASHVFYGWKGNLSEVFVKICESMKPGGFFVSNHMYMDKSESMPLSSTVLEFAMRLAGYPGHHLSEDELRSDLARAGFTDCVVSRSDETQCLLLGARKI